MKLKKMPINWSLKETGLTGYDQKLICSNNPWQKIWNNIQKYGKARKDKKRLIYTFACLLNAASKVWFLEGRLGTMLYLDLNLY